MSVTSPDFESGAYTNFATPAFRADNNKASSDRSATFPIVPQWGNSVLVEQVAVRSHGYNTLVAPLASQIKAAVATWPTGYRSTKGVDKPTKVFVVERK